MPPTLSVSDNVVNFTFPELDNMRFVTVYEEGMLVDRIGDIHAPYQIPDNLQRKNVYILFTDIGPRVYYHNSK